MSITVLQQKVETLYDRLQIAIMILIVEQLMIFII